MKNIKRKIITGAVFSACVAVAIIGGSVVTDKAEAIPTSVAGITEETPIIVLDAGHHEYVLSIVI